MKAVILDAYTVDTGNLSWSQIECLCELRICDRCSNDKNDIISKIGDAEIVITNKTPITAEILDACPNIRFISVLATGYNVVDHEYAARKSIPVSNVPSYGTDIVAQYAIALLLELCHRVGHHSEEVKKGRWSTSLDWCFQDYPMIELAGKTMGIIGLGRIGTVTAGIAKAIGMRVIAYNRTQREQSVAEYVELDKLLESSDVIVLHCPLSPQTKGKINAESISRMKDGVFIINNSRGPLIDEQALADALKSGKVAGAGLDVVSSEPIDSANPLLSAPNCFVTPHISWASKESRERIIACTGRNIAAFISGSPINVVNGG